MRIDEMRMRADRRGGDDPVAACPRASKEGRPMAEYELVRVETDDPEGYVRALLRGEVDDLTVERLDGGSLTVFASSHGLRQKFLFTLI